MSFFQWWRIESKQTGKSKKCSTCLTKTATGETDWSSCIYCKMGAGTSPAGSWAAPWAGWGSSSAQRRWRYTALTQRSSYITLTRSTADRGDDAVGGQGRGREGGHAGVLQHDDGGHQETHQLLTCCCYSKIGINFNCSIHSNHFTKCLSRPN